MMMMNVYLDHLKFCVVCINGRRYVCCGECYVVSDECDESTSCLVQPIVAPCCEVMYFGCFGFRGELGSVLITLPLFLNCIVFTQQLNVVSSAYIINWKSLLAFINGKN